MFVLGKDHGREDIHSHCGSNKQGFLAAHPGKVVSRIMGSGFTIGQIPRIIELRMAGQAEGQKKTRVDQREAVESGRAYANHHA